jgi:hypothetical protein
MVPYWASPRSLALCPGKGLVNMEGEVSIPARAPTGPQTQAKDMCGANSLALRCLAGNEPVMGRKAWVN